MFCNEICAFPAAPCSLSAITAFPQCHNSSIFVVWELMEGSSGSTVYTATAEASDHTYLSCNNTGTSCYLYGAQCDLYYTIIVAASSDQCSSMRSPPYRVSMGTLQNTFHLLIFNKTAKMCRSTLKHSVFSGLCFNNTDLSPLLRTLSTQECDG